MVKKTKEKKMFGHTTQLSNDNLCIVFSPFSRNQTVGEGTFVNFVLYTNEGDFFERLCYSSKVMKQVVKQVEDGCSIEDVLIWKEFEEL
ncbi:MAG: hypothetical protein KJO69_01575 [Gammaproteobacteria bacterium]|nr:hypothetical protein [Gammaproteobacteria bacterium]